MCFMNMTCGKCGKTSDIEEWVKRPLSGELPRDEFQCPRCGYAFKRQPGGEWSPMYDGSGRVAAVVPERIDLVPVPARL
jgi:ribosomal protein S27AE